MADDILMEQKTLQISVVTKGELDAHQSQINRFLATVFDASVQIDPSEEFHCALLIKLQGEIIGCGLAYIREMSQETVQFSAAIIGAIAVCEAHRGKGLCKKVVAELDSELLSLRISHSFLFAYHPNTYLSSGYRALKAPIHYFDKTENKWKRFVYRGGMVKQLSDLQLDPHQQIEFQGCVY